MNEATRGPRASHMTKTRPAFIKSRNLFVFVRLLLRFHFFFRLVKIASTSSMNCSSHVTVRYSMEQAMSMVMDDQLPNVPAGDTVTVTLVRFEIFFVDFIVSEL